MPGNSAAKCHFCRSIHRILNNFATTKTEPSGFAGSVFQLILEYHSFFSLYADLSIPAVISHHYKLMDDGGFHLIRYIIDNIYSFCLLCFCIVLSLIHPKDKEWRQR